MLSILNSHMCVEVVNGVQVRSRTRRTELSSSRDARPRHGESSIASRVDGGWWTVSGDRALAQFRKDPKKRRRRRRQGARGGKKSKKAKKDARRRRRSRVRVKGTQRWRTLRRRRVTPSRCRKSSECHQGASADSRKSRRARGTIEDLRWRIKLSKDVLPTIAFFTFTHAHDFLLR